MEVMTTLPTVRDGVQFTCSGHGSIQMHVEFCDERSCVSETVTFVRSDSRWRWLRGPFASARTVAAFLFDFQDKPSAQEIHFAQDVVDSVGGLLDSSLVAIAEGIAKGVQRRTKPPVDYFANTAGEVEFGNTHATYVYLMRHQNGLTKIGRSRCPRAREKTLQAEDPRLEMVFSSKSSAATETRLHRIFDAVRVRGEWFELLPHHVDWIVAVLEGTKGG